MLHLFFLTTKKVELVGSTKAAILFEHASMCRQKMSGHRTLIFEIYID